MSTITDKEVDELLLQAGLTPAEVESRRPVYPELKLFLEVFHRLMAKRLVDKLMESEKFKHLFQ